jgi:hypothetical protein
MRMDRRERLISILEIQSQTGKTSRIRAFMRKALEEAGMTVQKRDRQLFAWKGDVNEPVPVFVAHSDTVHAIVAPEKYAVGMYTDKGDIIYHAFDPTTRKWRGVGGDDKCGLWVALEAAHALPNVGVIITIDEESGCKGARLLTPEDSAHASILIQADRRGNDDAVRKTFSGTLSGDDWQEHVKDDVLAHGYDWCNFGASTDVAAMKRAVSAVNLSAGYHSPHSPYEYVSETDVENALELALALAEKSGRKKLDHVSVQTATRWQGTSYNYGGFNLKSGVRQWDTERGAFFYPDTAEYAFSFSGRHIYLPETVVEVMGETADQIRDVLDIFKCLDMGRTRQNISGEKFIERYHQAEYAKRCDVMRCHHQGDLDEEHMVVFCAEHMTMWKERYPIVVSALEVANLLGITKERLNVTTSALALPYSQERMI